MLKKSEKDKILQTLKSCKDFGDVTEYYKKLKSDGDKLKEKQQTSLTIRTFEALGNKHRFIILESLKDKDRCVCELEAILQQSQPVVSHHLKRLEEVDLIKGWKKGKFTHFSLIKKNFQKISVMLSELVENSTNWFGEVT
jgi:ArsR family transcriptional regulator